MWKFVADNFTPELNTLRTFGSAALICAYFVRHGTEHIRNFVNWARGIIQPRIAAFGTATLGKMKRSAPQSETLLGMRIASPKRQASIDKMQSGRRYRYINDGYVRLPDLNSRDIYRKD